MTKIGITCQWHCRSKSLKIGEKTQLLGLFQADELAEAEKELHDEFRESRLPGSEYFNLNKKQIKELLLFMSNKYQNVSKYFDYFDKVKKAKNLEITHALHCSAHDWFRLCHSSWHRRIIELAENDLYAKDCFFKKEDFNIFCKEIKETIDNLSDDMRDTYANWYLQWDVTQNIWYQLIDNFECWIPKKSLQKTFRYDHIYGRYYSEYKFPNPKFEDIIFSLPEFLVCEKTNCTITKPTLKVIYSIVCEYRFVEYVKRAFECMDDDFKHYYDSYGPTKKNKLLSGCGDKWIGNYGKY